MRLHYTRVIVAGVLLAAGCGHSPVNASWRTELRKGAPIENYKLIRITPEGKAVFHNEDAGDDNKVFPYFDVAVGESFGLETQGRRRTIYQFTVERADAESQKATVLIRRTEY